MKSVIQKQQDVAGQVKWEPRLTDPEISESVINALKCDTSVPDERIKVSVQGGAVTLEGQVDWNYQCSSARMAVEHLAGVRSVMNYIIVRPSVKPENVRQNIKAAFHHSAMVDADKVKVEIVGSLIILTGTVRSFAEREDAEHAAWAAPGVLKVENNLKTEGKSFPL